MNIDMVLCGALLVFIGVLIGFSLCESIEAKEIAKEKRYVEIQQEAEAMKITDVVKYVSRNQKGKVKIPVAQISEVLKTANKKVKGKIYKAIREA